MGNRYFFLKGFLVPGALKIDLANSGQGGPRNILDPDLAGNHFSGLLEVCAEGAITGRLREERGVCFIEKVLLDLDSGTLEFEAQCERVPRLVTYRFKRLEDYQWLTGEAWLQGLGSIGKARCVIFEVPEEFFFLSEQITTPSQT
ncbi:MAG: hypothetical protein K8Q91_00305 [Candidatus Vogelbacteria bacterium]|nr:hypothetical protein [Candidatus Vogelbacteria bacterium]